MAVITRDEMLQIIRGFIGETPDDNGLKVLEDFNDTLDDYYSRITESGNWKTKYEENDREWRKRYSDRFYSPEPPGTPAPMPYAGEYALPGDDEEPKTYDDLFEEVK